MSIKTLSGKNIYPIGIGTWGIGGTWETVHGNEANGIEAIRYSISKGQNHIDSGQIYGAGYTDQIIGQAIAGLRRQDLYIGDKIWETSVAKGKVRPAVETMLKKLGTDYMDLLYIHKPWEDWPWREAVSQINELIDDGIVRQIGVSNFNAIQLGETIKLSKHRIVANQLHFNVIYKQEVDDGMKQLCNDNGIQIIAYRPLEQGKVLQNKKIQAIARDKSITPGQVALAWLLHKGVLVIPGATDKNLINQNVAAVNVKLSADEVAILDKI